MMKLKGFGRKRSCPNSSSSLSLYGLEESPVPACSIVVSLSIVFLFYLCLVFRMVDICMPVVECGYVPFFADVLSIYSCILILRYYPSNLKM
jgi:hypothetical protein